MAVQRWYPSKVDWWLAIVLALAPVVAVGGLVTAVMEDEAVIAAVVGVGILAAVYLGLVFPMRYGIDDDHLVVRHGIVRQHIPLKAIVSVAPTRNPLSSPALSLDRLAIKFGEGFFKTAMISPTPRAEFVDELAARADLRREGDRLVR